MKTRYSQANQAFLERLKAARRAAHLSQDELARALGRPQSFMSKVESGERRLDIVEFLYLCAAMQIDPAAFIAGFAEEFIPKKTARKSRQSDPRN